MPVDQTTLWLAEALCYLLVVAILGVWRQASGVAGTLIGKESEWVALLGIPFFQAIAKGAWALSIPFDPLMGVMWGGARLGAFSALALVAALASALVIFPLLRMILTRFLPERWGVCLAFALTAGLASLGVFWDASPMRLSDAYACVAFSISAIAFSFWAFKLRLQKVKIASLGIALGAIGSLVFVIGEDARWSLAGVMWLSFWGLTMLHARVREITRGVAREAHAGKGALAWVLSSIPFALGAAIGSTGTGFFSLSCELLGAIGAMLAMNFHFRGLNVSVASYIEKVGVDRARRLLDGVVVSAFLCDSASGRVIECSQAAMELCERPRSELIGANVWEALGIDAMPMDRGDAESRAGRLLRVSRNSLSEDQAGLEVITALDVSEQRQAQLALQRLASFDSLTQLPSRHEALARLGALVERSVQGEGPPRSFGLLFLDLDHFKSINDAKGHAAGDALLRACATLFDSISRAAGGWVARLGGDEFVAILPGGEQAASVALAQSLIDEIDSSDFAAGSLGLSVGVAMFPRDGANPEDLIRRADAAMYEAKGSGRGRVNVFGSHIEQRLLRHVFVDSFLRQALREEAGLSLWLQPILTPDGVWLGEAEALLRAPGSGVNVVELIGSAEKSALIAPLGRWVLQEALRMQTRAQHADVALSISINVSSRQFSDTSFWALLAERAQSDPLASRLTLEVTETALMQDRELASRCLLEAREQGYQIALDDFGSGYSSLSMLKSVPIAKLKIDKGLLDNVPEDPQASRLAQAAFAMGAAMGLELVAEGVERAEQARWIQEQGVERIQGFYFAKPMPEADFLRWAQELMEGRPQSREL